MAARATRCCRRKARTIRRGSAASRVWIVDPLDGTREYSEGRPDWAVHVALAVDGAPRRGRGGGARAGPGVPLGPGRDGRGRRRARGRSCWSAGRGRRPKPRTIAALLGAELVAMGSAGAKAMAVVAGEADLYYHAGGQHEWDNCAPAAVALAAGLHASRLDGSALVYNRADTNVPDLLIARPEYAARILGFCSHR